MSDSTIRTTAELAAAMEAHDAARDRDPSEPSPEPAPEPSILAQNPHRRAGDPTLAEWAALSLSEMDELDEVNSGLSDRVFRAAAWDERRAADDWRKEKEAARARLQEEIAADPAKTASYLEAQDVERFRVRYWQLAPDERVAEAERLGIATFTPPEHTFDCR